MGLRTQLLLVSLTILLLPWAGCHYVQEMEGALRENQSQALLQQSAILGRLAQTAELPWDLPEALFYTPRRYQPVQVDGYGDDWQNHVTETLSASPSVTLQKALYQDRLYLFLQVKRSNIHYHNPGLPFSHSDHVRLTTHDGRVRRQWVLFTSAPGQLQAYQWLRQQQQLQPLQDMEAWWQETRDGFNLEISVAQQDLLPNIVLQLYQVAAQPEAQLAATSLRVEQSRGEHWLRPLPALASLLQAQRTDQLDAVLVDPQGWPLSPQKDWINQPPAIEPPTDPESLLNQGMSRFYRLLIDLLTPSDSQTPWPLQAEELSAKQDRFDLARLKLQHAPQAGWYQLQDQQRSALLVSQPLYAEGKLQGYLLLSQTGDALISLTNQALRRVTHLTLGVLILVIVALVAFASSLSWRIRSLKQSAEQAISSDGKVNRFKASKRPDEIGDLSRSYQNLLQRVQGYTEYLETLNGKLAHELRTPLAIVKSSLELARSQTDTDNTHPQPLSDYLQRAEEGSERLRQILSAMSEASRVEQTIQQSEIRQFDLVPLLTGLTQAYADTYPNHHYQMRLDVTTAPLQGSPELMAQLLDKLVDNARSFAPTGTPITLGLQREQDHRERAQLRLWVRNEGSTLPDQLQHQLFDSLVSMRDQQHRDGSPHLGLGLYIVRLIAAAHQGQVHARNLPQNNGVEFSITLTENAAAT
ncbi:ATP-binding protein [Ketobacter alkanivorans]|uniref:histidine kinase n=1 Tax=Ketobacter alkanivorans TaxID=1917421 RepID=A0A2K9LM27_9GAMM|nr:ATP-binding protein [Ketobacter alkanivorans]AUM13406.1 hypothetical protein Kalk_13680 [Ketobacter alkanivorans]